MNYCRTLVDVGVVFTVTELCLSQLRRLQTKAPEGLVCLFQLLVLSAFRGIDWFGTASLHPLSSCGFLSLLTLSKFYSYKNTKSWAGEMAHWLRTCSVPAEDRGLTPSTDIRQLTSACDSNSKGCP